MRVVITGGAGFIGSNLANYWTRRYQRDQVIVFDALTYAARRENLEDSFGRANFEFVRGDVCDLALLKRRLGGADLVLHLAAETHNDRAIRDPLIFVRSNSLGTATLLEACRACDVPRFHQVSTDEVYGALDLATPDRFSADSAYRPNGPYSASKASADHFVRAWANTYGMKVTISNCGNNFGPFQFPEKLIPLAITRALSGLPVQLYGDGRHVRDWIFVEDHCTAIDRIAHRGEPGRTYLVSAGFELSNREVVGRILSALGQSLDSIEYVADRLGHDRRYALDPSRLRSELEWAPKFTFDEGLAQTIDWYKNHRDWWASGGPKPIARQRSVLTQSSRRRSS